MFRDVTDLLGGGDEPRFLADCIDLPMHKASKEFLQEHLTNGQLSATKHAKLISNLQTILLDLQRMTTTRTDPTVSIVSFACSRSRRCFFLFYVVPFLVLEQKKTTWVAVDTIFEQLSARRVDWRGRGVPEPKIEITRVR